jgi:hypothetical protein
MSPCAGAPQVSEAPQPLGERGFGEYGSKEQTFHIVIIYTFFVTVDRQMMTIYDKRQHTSTTLKRAVHSGGVEGWGWRGWVKGTEVCRRMDKGRLCVGPPFNRRGTHHANL